MRVIVSVPHGADICAWQNPRQITSSGDWTTGLLGGILVLSERNQQMSQEQIPTSPLASNTAAESSDASATAPGETRSCGGCTACCDGWLTANILGHDVAPGKPCHFRGAGGCTIYEDRPRDPCRGFVCGWLRKGSPFPESFRPDRLGVIILAKPWRKGVAYVLVPAGRAPDATLLGWMRQYSTATGTPFLFNLEGRPRGYGSPEFQMEILDKASRGEPLLPGLNPRPGGPCKLVSQEV